MIVSAHGFLCVASLLMALLRLHGGHGNGCSWSLCSVTCGKGTRTRVGSGCTQPSTVECTAATSCYATHLDRFGVTVIQHPDTKDPIRAKVKVIDGIPASVDGQSLHSTKCASTKQGNNPWVRLDLKKAYLVSLVSVIIHGTTGKDVAVHVGNSLTNNGNINKLCGKVPDAERDKAIWRNVSCSPPEWGQYINFDRTVKKHYLDICEAAFEYDASVDIRIQSLGTNINGRKLSVSKGQGLSTVDCTVIENTANFSVSLTWKVNGNNVPTVPSGQGPDIYQVNKNNMQRLYITKTSDSDDGVYSCHASVGNATVLSRSFALNFKVGVDCVWGSWSACSESCGVGSESRTKVILKQHGGRDCTGESRRDCGVRPPCRPTVNRRTISVDEGKRAELSCQASQFYALRDPIKFGWFKVQKGSLPVSVKTNRRVMNTTVLVSVSGRGKNFTGSLTFGNAKRGDSGDYKCKAYNRYGSSELSAAANIIVKYGPESITIQPAKRVGVKGRAFTFTCSADGLPQPTYWWMPPNGQYQVGKTLTLKDIQFADGGIYTCWARNTINSGFRSIRLQVMFQVEGPPQECDRPSANSYKGSNMAVNVSCLNDGSSAITKFEIQYSKASGQWKSVTFNVSVSQPFIVRDLTPFTWYEVRVRAGNKYNYEIGNVSFSDPVRVRTAEGGQSLLQKSNDVNRIVNVSRTTTNVTLLNPFSTYSIQVIAVTIRTHDFKVLTGLNSKANYFITVEDAPSKPHRLSFVPQPPSQVDLNWAEPLTPNGIIRHYIVHYWRQDGTGNRTAVGPVEGLNVSLLNLTPSTVYNVSVQAYTVGYGPAASIDVISHSIRPTPPQNVIVSAYIVPDASSSGSGSTPTIVAIVVVALVILLAIIIIVIVVRKRHKNGRESSVGSGLSMFSFFAKKQKQSGNEYDIKESSVDEPESPVKSSEVLSITSYEGTTVILPCDATGDTNTKPKIQWFFGDTFLPGGDSRFVVLGDGALQISGVQNSDCGMYRCTATSDEGTNEQTVELVVHSRDEAEKQLNLWELTDSVPKLRRKPSKAGLHAIGKHEFPGFVASMHKDDNAGFFAEFQTLDSTHCDLPATAAQANLRLNRYKNILTYDHARVVLPALEGMTGCYGDYIAAAYVDGYRRPKKYIASQGPQKKTVIDSWRMIWAENVPTIVMLTHLKEGDKVKCHQYWPKNDGETMNYDGLVVTLVETDSFSDHAIRKLAVTLKDETRRIKHYHFTSWPDHGVPKFATGLLGFMRRINREHPRDKGPMMVHCSAGVGRTGTFIVIDTMMEKLEDHQPIDIYNCVASLRTKRQEMVQSEIQYSFIHDAVLEALVCGNTEVPIQSLRIAISKLSKPDLKTKQRAYDRHFEILETTGPKMEKHLCRAGQQTTVAGKNRYKSIIPLDTQRVILHVEDSGPDSAYANAEPGSDYINASYLDGYHRRDAFITTQGPLAKTVNDFWKMIWQKNSSSIVMLTSLEEDGEEMCCQYWPASGSSQYGQYTVSLQNETSIDEYVKRTLTVSKGAETRTVGQFHYTQWPDKGSPKTKSQLLNMMEQLQRWQQSTDNTVITVHCNNGVGRTGVFCVLLSLIEQVKVENLVDVFLKVRSVRIQNPLIVQTVGQYKLIYEAVLAYMDGFGTYANFK